MRREREGGLLLALGRQPWCCRPGGWMVSPLGDVTRRAAGEPRDS